MDNKNYKWCWQDGTVDLQKEYIELGYEDDPNTVPIALIGIPENHVFSVQWLVGTDVPENKHMINLVKRELNFYLLEKEEPDPWAYAQYHCTTASNMYSSVYWSYYPEGSNIIFSLFPKKRGASLRENRLFVIRVEKVPGEVLYLLLV